MKILAYNAEYVGFARIQINIKICAELNTEVCADGI